MLKRQPIRIKLMAMLGLLSAIVLLLAFSGIFGLYQYRPVSEAIRQQTKLLAFASALHQRAEAMHESYEKIRMLPSTKGMIEATPLIDNVDLKWNVFEHSLVRFGLELGPLHDVSADEQSAELGFGLELSAFNNAAEPQPRSSLVNTSPQQDKLAEIRDTFQAIEEHYVRPKQFDVFYDHQMADRLETLKTYTSEHLDTVEEAMGQVSDYVDAQYRVYIAMAATCTLVAVVIVGVLLLSFRSSVMKPFSTLLDGSRLVAGGQFDHRIDLGTDDELSELAMAMNDMTDRFQGALAQVNAWCTDLDHQVRQRTREVIQNEQLASVGFLAAGVAHEINNPLATIAWSSESLQSRMAELMMLPADQRLADEELCEALTVNLRRIEEEAYRCKGITEKLLDFSRLSEVQRASTDLVELVEDVVAMVSQIGKYRCKTLRVHADGPVTAQVNPREIRQVVLNLVTNALESVASDGAVDVYCKSDHDYATVLVKDNGCGMSREVLQHIFEPFFTRRRDGTGTGLGLSITYRIVSQHGGSLIPNSDGEGCGSEMEMRLPLEPDTENVSPMAAGNSGILLSTTVPHPASSRHARSNVSPSPSLTGIET